MAALDASATIACRGADRGDRIDAIVHFDRGVSLRPGPRTRCGHYAIEALAAVGHFADRLINPPPRRALGDAAWLASRRLAFANAPVAGVHALAYPARRAPPSAALPVERADAAPCPPKSGSGARGLCGCASARAPIARGREPAPCALAERSPRALVTASGIAARLRDHGISQSTSRPWRARR